MGDNSDILHFFSITLFSDVKILSAYYCDNNHMISDWSDFSILSKSLLTRLFNNSQQRESHGFKKH